MITTPRVKVICLAMLLGLTLLVSASGEARALAGGDGLIAIGTGRGIEVVDPFVDGAEPAVLIPRTWTALGDPAWSPTGQLIAFANGANEIWVARANGAGMKMVSDPEENAYAPAWSPDGRLAFRSDGGRGLVIVDHDGSHRTMLRVPDPSGPAEAGLARDPAWTPDGRLFAGVWRTGEQPQPSLADGDGTHWRPLTYPSGEPPDYYDISSGWQFSSTGRVGRVLWDDQFDSYWVFVSSFRGNTVIEPPATSRSGFTDVALSPSGNLVAATRPPDAGSTESWLGIWDVDLGAPDPWTPVVSLTVEGNIYGMDWQARCTIEGTPGDDALVGTSGVDMICGGAGDDTITGLGGNDVVYAGPGDDIVRAGLGRDVVVGDRGDDLLATGSGHDLINSRRDGLGRDRVRAGPQRDVCLHDSGDDIWSC